MRLLDLSCMLCAWKTTAHTGQFFVQFDSWEIIEKVLSNSLKRLLDLSYLSLCVKDVK